MARPLTDIDAGREQLIVLAIELIEERGSSAITASPARPINIEIGPVINAKAWMMAVTMPAKIVQAIIIARKAPCTASDCHAWNRMNRSLL